jgi:hypothetical protein
MLIPGKQYLRFIEKRLRPKPIDKPNISGPMTGQVRIVKKTVSKRARDSTDKTARTRMPG